MHVVGGNVSKCVYATKVVVYLCLSMCAFVCIVSN